MTFSDSFAGTAGTKLAAHNAGWTVLLGTAAPSDEFSLDGSGHVQRVSGASAAVFYGTGNDSTTTQSVTADFNSSVFGNHGTAVLGQVTGGKFTGYYLSPNSASTMRIYKVTNNVATALWVSTGAMPSGNLLGVTMQVSLVGGHPTFVVKQGGTPLSTGGGSLSDTTNVSTSGQRGIVAVTSSSLSNMLGNYADDYTAPAAVTWTLTEPQNGFVFEGLKTTSSVSVPVSWVGTPGNVQARLVNSVGGAAVSGFDWSTKIASPAANSSGTVTFSGVPLGGPYSVQVRDTASGIEKDGSNQWSVGGVLPIWGRSQAKYVFTGQMVGGDAALAPTTGSKVSVMITSGVTPGDTSVALSPGIQQLSGGQGTVASGIVALANQWQADTGNTPLMIVDASVPSMSIVDFNTDMTLTLTLTSVTGTFTGGETITRTGGYTGVVSGYSAGKLQLNSGSSSFPASGTVTGSTSGATGTITAVWNIWTGYVTQMLNASGNQASGVLMLPAETGATGFNAAYGGYMTTFQGRFAALIPSYSPTYAIVPQLRSDAGVFQDGLRQAMYTSAVSGAPFALGGFQSDHQLDQNGGVHQLGGATGNERIGVMLGRVAAWQLYNSGLTHFGPTVTSAQFTDHTYTAIKVTFDRAIQTPSAVTTGLRGIHISTDSGATFPDPPDATFSTAITASNQITITKTSGSWVLGSTRLDFLRGVPFTSNSLETGPYTGVTEANMESTILSKVITDTSGFNGSRGMTVRTAMGTGFGVTDASNRPVSRMMLLGVA